MKVVAYYEVSASVELNERPVCEIHLIGDTK
jgi:hypothetical protein